MYINLTVIFTSKYVQKVTGNRGILTRHLTISCQIHIYVALWRTYRTATQSSPEKSMYITEDLSVNNTRRFFKKRPELPHRSQPIRERRGRRAPPPTKKRRGHTRDGGRGLRTARPSFISTQEIRHITSFSTLWIFSCFFFLHRFCEDKGLVHLQNDRLVFFPPIYTYILIGYGSLSQFELQRHAGEAEGGRRGGALVKVEYINTAGVCRCWWTPGIRWRGCLLCRRQHLEERMKSISK